MSQNQKEALAAYLIANREKFYRLAFSYVRSQEAALDIVQNAVVKGLEHAESIREMAYIKTWFYRILVNESLSYMKNMDGKYPWNQNRCGKSLIAQRRNGRKRVKCTKRSWGCRKR